jgi:DNA-binding CsgD family transcriptional regulator
MVLLAHVQLAAGDYESATELASVVVRDPQGTPSETVCEAHEVLGRAARGFDIDAAEGHFLAELKEAEKGKLSIWRARALHELGTIDLLDNMRLERLQLARRAAVETGVPSTLAAADFHLAEALVSRDETLAGRSAAGRAAALARRIGSPLLPWATLTIARSYAHERDDLAMEQAIHEALSLGQADLAIHAGVAGRVRAMRAAHGADRFGTLRHLDEAARMLESLPGHHFTHWGLWVLLVTAIEPARHVPALEQASTAAGADTRFNKALIVAAQAVARGAEGDKESAQQLWQRAEDALAGYEAHDWLLHLTRWAARDVAWRDGWGEPIRWAQETVRWCSERGHEPLATDGRRFLKHAGAPVPRRGRGETQVPPPLRELGVTSREADVLTLVALRLTNAEIAARLVLSPRTVEKHVASLLTKTGCPNRRALAALMDDGALTGEVS